MLLGALLCGVLDLVPEAATGREGRRDVSAEAMRTLSFQCLSRTFLVEPMSSMTNTMHSSIYSGPVAFLLALIGSAKRWSRTAYEYDPSERFTNAKSFVFNEPTALVARSELWRAIA